MGIRIRRFAPGDAAAIERLNGRLRAGGVSLEVYPEGAEQGDSRALRERLFVAADEEEVRGAVWLREVLFRTGGGDVTCGWLKYPLAESLIDPVFSGVPGSLLIQCLREQPRLMALGFGGFETPLGRMLTRLGWPGSTVPFLFYINRPRAVLRELEPLRKSPWRRAVATLASASGLGSLFLGVAHRLRASGLRLTRLSPRISVERVDRFGEWADLLWMNARDKYAFLARRDTPMLEAMLPQSPDVHRLRVRRDAQDIGWVALVRHDFSVGAPDPRFGRLTVGLIADGLCAPPDVADIVRAAFDWLRDRGTDLLISNQAHPAWVTALTSLGFFSGPSNLGFARSPSVERLIAGGLAGGHALHINRGDGDGPMWFGQ